MLSGESRPQVVRVNATVTHDGRTWPTNINLADVSTTRELATGTGQRQLILVMRTGDKVVLIGDEAAEFERTWHGLIAREQSDRVDLTLEQRRYLQTVFHIFQTTGQWPTYWALHRR